MPVTARETKDSRSFQGGNRLDFKYIVFRTFDIDEVYDAVFTTAVNPFGIWLPQFQQISIEPLGGGVWNATLPYGVGDIPVSDAPGAPTGPGGAAPPPPPAPGENDPLGMEWSFDTTGGTTHVTQALAAPLYAIRRGDLTGTPPETHFAIGVDKDKVNGVDVTSPTQRFSVTRKFPVMTHGYLKTIEKLTGSVNSVAYLDRAARELLFLGASGSWKQVEGFTVTFQFAFSPNLPNVEICTGLVIPDKPGWHHLWVTYTEEPSAGYAFPRPLDAFVSKIYKEEDFDQLGLFT